MGKCRLLAACIGKAYILKCNSVCFRLLLLRAAALICKRRLCIQNLVKTHARSHSLGNCHDQVGKCDQSDQDLVHIVYKGNHLTLCQGTDGNLLASIPQDSDNGKVHDYSSCRI